MITLKNNSQAVIIEADFTVIESTAHQPGETKGWTWFPGDEYGYQDGRARAFIETCGACVGDTTEATELGDQLASPTQPGRGVVMNCTVTEVINKDGSKRVNDKGKPVTNSSFQMIMQTLEQVAEARKELDATKPLKLNAAQVSSPAPAPMAPSPAAKTSLLGGLGKR